jgi:hypothetical protein
MYTAEARSRNESINIGVCLNLPNPCKASNSSCVKWSSFNIGDGGVVAVVGGDIGCNIVVVVVVVVVDNLLLLLLLIRGPSSSEESAAVVLDDMINSGVVSGSYLIVEGLNSLIFVGIVVIEGSNDGTLVSLVEVVVSLAISVLVFVVVFAVEELAEGDLLRDL